MKETITARDAASCLGLSVRTVERWARQGRIPASKRSGSWELERNEVRTWAAANRLSFDDPCAQPQQHPPTAVSLVDCITRGGIFHEVPGNDVPSVLSFLVERTPIAAAARDELVERLLAREKLTSTGIGGGIAIPHPRDPHELGVEVPFITVGRLAQPVDFNALDGTLVSTVFLTVSPSTPIHLQLLSHLAFCLRDELLCSLLAAEQVSTEELIGRMTALESQIGPPQRG